MKAPECTYTLPTFLSLCTLRTSWFCLEAEGGNDPTAGRVYRHYEDLRRAHTRARPECQWHRTGPQGEHSFDHHPPAEDTRWICWDQLDHFNAPWVCTGCRQSDEWKKAEDAAAVGTPYVALNDTKLQHLFGILEGSSRLRKAVSQALHWYDNWTVQVPHSKILWRERK